MDRNTLQKELLEAGVHFGHQKKKWNPKMLPYIYGEKKGIHIIDLNKTMDCLEEAAQSMKTIAKSGRKILFVATKKQAQDIVETAAQKCGMPYVTERWLGGMLTNFTTIRKSVKKMQSIEKMLNDGSLDSVTKKEKLTLTRSKDKMERVLGGIENMNRTPAAIYIVDINAEHLALSEARKLNIQGFAMVDTNSNPNLVDHPIPANDDASKSISLITNYLTSAILEGLEERALEKSAEKDQDKDEEVELEILDEEGDQVATAEADIVTPAQAVAESEEEVSEEETTEEEETPEEETTEDADNKE